MQKRAILLGFLFIFQGIFIFKYLNIYIGGRTNTNLIHPITFYIILSILCIYLFIFTLIFVYMEKSVLFDKKPIKTLFFGGFLVLESANKNKQCYNKNNHQNKQQNSFYYTHITSLPYISLIVTIFTLIYI